MFRTARVPSDCGARVLQLLLTRAEQTEQEVRDFMSRQIDFEARVFLVSARSKHGCEWMW